MKVLEDIHEETTKFTRIVKLKLNHIADNIRKAGLWWVKADYKQLGRL